MNLYIMRHGIAEDHTPKGDDAARKLTAKGSDKIAKAASGIRAMELSIEAILASPITRAAETAAIVSKEIGTSATLRKVSELTTGTSPDKVLDALAKLRLPENVMVVGHEPTMSRLASLLLSGSSEAVAIRLKEGGVIALELPDGIQKGAAQLRWMLTQRQLRKMTE
jgi:phosphohistidine phosphatase